MDSTKQVDDKTQQNADKIEIQQKQNEKTIVKPNQQEQTQKYIVQKEVHAISDQSIQNQGQIVNKSQNSEPELDVSQLFFVTPVPATDLYFGFYNKQLVVFNKEKQVKAVLKAPCKYIDTTEYPIYHSCAYQPFFFQNTLYFQFADEIYFLEENFLNFFCRIPDFQEADPAQYFGRMIELNGKLLFSNTQYFISFSKENSSYTTEFQEFNYEFENSHFQFCKQILVFHPKQCFCSVPQDDQYQQIKVCDEQFDKFVFCNAGICIFSNEQEQIIFNMLDFSYVKVSGYNETEIESKLVLNEFGLSLDDEILKGWFGQEFLWQRRIMANEYQQNAMDLTFIKNSANQGIFEDEQVDEQ